MQFDVFANVIHCLAKKKKTWPHVQCCIVVFDNKRVDLTSSEVSDTDVGSWQSLTRSGSE